MEKILSVILCLVLCLGLFGCANNEAETTTDATSAAMAATETTAAAAEENELVILYTNDVHNAYQRDDEQGRLGYAALAAYKKALEDEGRTVILIDGGDAIQGEAVGTLSKGAYLVDIMNEMDYAIAVPGNHEFDFGMDTFLDLANNRAEYTYIACNFIDLRTGETVFEPYIIEEYNGVEVAYVGICTPESFTKSTPTYFQDDEGNYIYSFAEGNDGQDLYDCVQAAINDAKDAGADYVICVGHTGIEPSASPWTSTEIIANTSGMTAYLDAHSHSVIAGKTVDDLDGKPVMLLSTGTKLNYVGQLVIDLNTGLLNGTLHQTDLTEDDPEMLAYTDSIAAQFEDLLNEVVATSEVDLIINDPDNADQRLIRSQETNLGDLCADAYRVMTGADIGFTNGGGIRAEIPAGDVTYGDIIAVHPFGNSLCMVEASGQEILDALEMAYRFVGEGENGGFQHVSGITLEINTSIASSVVVDDKDNFVEVAGERRVQNVMVGGEPIDPEKTYTLAAHNYLLKSGGDGVTIFMDNALLLDEVMLDNQVLIRYIQEVLGGVITAEQYGEPLGEGRIVILED